MALTLSGTNGVVGAGFTVDASGVSVTAGVGTFGSLAAPAAGLTGALPALSAASLTSIPAANLVGVCTSGLTKTGGFGKILQYKVAKKVNSVSTTSQSYSEISSDFRITLTPTASDSTIVVTAYLFVANSNNANTFRLRRNTASDFSGTSTEVIQPETFSANEDGLCSVYETSSHMFTLPVTGYETSGNTTARTYSVFWRVGGGTMYLGRLYNLSLIHI